MGGKCTVYDDTYEIKPSEIDYSDNDDDDNDDDEGIKERESNVTIPESLVPLWEGQRWKRVVCPGKLSFSCKDCLMNGGCVTLPPFNLLTRNDQKLSQLHVVGQLAKKVDGLRSGDKLLIENRKHTIV